MTPHVWELIPNTDLEFLSGETTRDYACKRCKLKITALYRDMRGCRYEAPDRDACDLSGEYTEDCDLVIVQKIQES
jgi:hypothetical protein